MYRVPFNAATALSIALGFCRLASSPGANLAQALPALQHRPPNSLPGRILCDNGGVWASTLGPALKALPKGLMPLTGSGIRQRSLSALEAWLISLGIGVCHRPPTTPRRRASASGSTKP